MKLTEILSANVNALVKRKRWTSNKPIIEASQKRLTNGTLGRIRSPEGENCRLNQLEELARVFSVSPHQLLAPELGSTDAFERALREVAAIATIPGMDTLMDHYIKQAKARLASENSHNVTHFGSGAND